MQRQVNRVYEEWDRISFSKPKMPVAERKKRAKALWELCRNEDKWTVDIDDAVLATSNVVFCAIEVRAWKEAIRFCRAFFDHPDIEVADWVSYDHYSVNLASALLLDGEVEIGLREFAEILERRPKAKTHQRNLVRNHLCALLERFEKSAPPDPRILKFVSELLATWKGQMRKASKVLRARTNEELLDIVDSTYPVRVEIPILLPTDSKTD